MSKLKTFQFNQRDCNSSAATQRRSRPATLANYRAAFGHGPGSTHFADQTPFDELCLKAMKERDTIASQQKEIGQLTALNARLSKQLAAVQSRAQAPETTKKERTPKAPRSESGRS